MASAEWLPQVGAPGRPDSFGRFDARTGGCMLIASRVSVRMKKSWLLIVVFVVVIGVVGMTVWVGSGNTRIPLLLVPVRMIYQAIPEKVATIGEPLREDSQASTHAVSERFGTQELHKLWEVLNSDSFQSPLTNYNCGEPIPKFTFQVTLFRASRAHAGARRVEWRYSPSIDFAGRGRWLDFGLDYLVTKTFAKIDLDPGATGLDRTTREPHGDCSKRDSKEEWVTWPGPDEKLW
jgi:hypothetical protein